MDDTTAAILEDLHRYASEELTHLGNTMPALLRSASRDVQDAFNTLESRYHALIARIDAHRNGLVPPGFTPAQVAQESTSTSTPPTSPPSATTSPSTSSTNFGTSASTATPTAK